MSRVYIATILATKTCRLRLVANSPEQAAAQLRLTHGAGLRLQTITPEGGSTEAEALAAFGRLMAAPFMDLLATTGVTLRQWVWRAANVDRDLNRQLAIAGLRLRGDESMFPDGLAVGSARSIPFLAEWFAGSAFEGEALIAALVHLPGAARTGSLTFAGTPSRAVFLPWETIANLIGDAP